MASMLDNIPKAVLEKSVGISATGKSEASIEAWMSLMVSELHYKLLQSSKSRLKAITLCTPPKKWNG